MQQAAATGNSHSKASPRPDTRGALASAVDMAKPRLSLKNNLNISSEVYQNVPACGNPGGLQTPTQSWFV